MAKKLKFVPTLTAIAKHFRVSETAVYSSKRRFDDFPKKHKNGYRLLEFEAFAKLHSIWSHRKLPELSNGAQLKKAVLRKTIAKLNNRLLLNEQDRRKLADHLAKFVQSGDVEQFTRCVEAAYKKAYATAELGIAAVESLPADVRERLDKIINLAKEETLKLLSQLRSVNGGPCA
jgi:hypothetical protein